MRIVYALGENPREAREALSEAVEKEYFQSLRDEDELYVSRPKGEELRYVESIVTGVNEHLDEIDSYIQKYAVGWQFHRISRTALAVMRVGMYEVLYMPDVPTRAAINEAVEIAKKYDTPETVAFVNGVLGAFAKSEVPDG